MNPAVPTIRAFDNYTMHHVCHVALTNDAIAVNRCLRAQVECHATWVSSCFSANVRRAPRYNFHCLQGGPAPEPEAVGAECSFVGQGLQRSADVVKGKVPWQCVGNEAALRARVKQLNFSIDGRNVPQDGVGVNRVVEEFITSCPTVAIRYGCEHVTGRVEDDAVGGPEQGGSSRECAWHWRHLSVKSVARVAIVMFNAVAGAVGQDQIGEAAGCAFGQRYQWRVANGLGASANDGAPIQGRVGLRYDIVDAVVLGADFDALAALGTRDNQERLDRAGVASFNINAIVSKEQRA
eukprot:TRINITY_DN11102_c0_g1_i1.p1 TRINITY_DN11102_c0_g1~~TRINITY_DN11102_c0_g1_i1.p1  ORF type:complete len:294 (-),score=28.53 TRINITY_DN11102_c0_g1_i1:1225-2106(-)